MLRVKYTITSILVFQLLFFCLELRFLNFKSMSIYAAAHTKLPSRPTRKHTLANFRRMWVARCWTLEWLITGFTTLAKQSHYTSGIEETYQQFECWT